MTHDKKIIISDQIFIAKYFIFVLMKKLAIFWIKITMLMHKDQNIYCHFVSC